MRISDWSSTCALPIFGRGHHRVNRSGKKRRRDVTETHVHRRGAGPLERACAVDVERPNLQPLQVCKRFERFAGPTSAGGKGRSADGDLVVFLAQELLARGMI